MSRPKPGAFSLLELLVVVALIVVLLTLLLPALANTKLRAQRVQCVSNLYQQGVALHSFLADNRSYPLWVAPTNNEPPGRWWADQLERNGFGVLNPPAQFWQQGVWRCPSGTQRQGSLVNTPYYGYNAFGVLGVGNLTNNFGLLGHENSGVCNPIAESEVVAPADMIAIGESDAFAFMRNLRYDFCGGIIRHKSKVNVLSCDGHVEPLSVRILFEDEGDAALVRWNRDHLAHRDRL